MSELALCQRYIKQLLSSDYPAMRPERVCPFRRAAKGIREDLVCELVDNVGSRKLPGRVWRGCRTKGVKQDLLLGQSFLDTYRRQGIHLFFRPLDLLFLVAYPLTPGRARLGVERLGSELYRSCTHRLVGHRSGGLIALLLQT